MKSKKRMITTLLTLSLLVLNSATAAYNLCTPTYEPCLGKRCWGGIDIGVDLIWWKLCRDDLDYAAKFNNSFEADSNNLIATKGEYKEISFDWEPGFRVRFTKEDLWCCLDLYGSYTYIKSCNSTKSTAPTGGVLESTLFHIGYMPVNSLNRLNGFYELNYQTFDILLSTDYCLRQCHNLKPYLGLTGVFLDQKEKSSGSTELPSVLEETAKFSWKDNYFGLGFKLGLEIAYNICDCFALFGNAACAVTVGDHDAKTTLKTDFQTVSHDIALKESECICVPGYQAAMGFMYENCWCGCDYMIRLGYEFIQWHNAPNVRRFVSGESREFALSTSSTVATIGFHGLFAGFDLQF